MRIFFVILACLLFWEGNAQRNTIGTFGERVVVFGNSTQPNLTIEFSGVQLLINLNDKSSSVAITLTLVETLNTTVPNNTVPLVFSNATAVRLAFEDPDDLKPTVSLILPVDPKNGHLLKLDEETEIYQEFSIASSSYSGSLYSILPFDEKSGLYVAVESTFSPQRYNNIIFLEGAQTTLQYPDMLSVEIQTPPNITLSFIAIQSFMYNEDQLSDNVVPLAFWSFYDALMLDDEFISATLHWQYNKTFVEMNNIDDVKFGYYDEINEKWIFTTEGGSVDKSSGIVSQMTNSLLGNWGVYAFPSNGNTVTTVTNVTEDEDSSSTPIILSQMVVTIAIMCTMN